MPKVQAPLDASLPGETAEWPELPSPKLAIVRIDSEPQGARVVVNGNVLNASTPTSVQTFAGYPSTIRLMQPGFLPTEKRELVGDDGVDVKGTLKKGKPELAKLRVETSPPGAKIFVNGNEVGTTPLLMERVGAGVELTLKLELAGHYPHGVIFALRKEELREIGVQLMPDTGPKRSSTVNVESIPQGAIVYDSWIEGGKKALGKTGQFALKVIRPIDGGPAISRRSRRSDRRPWPYRRSCWRAPIQHEKPSRCPISTRVAISSPCSRVRVARLSPVTSRSGVEAMLR